MDRLASNARYKAPEPPRYTIVGTAATTGAAIARWARGMTLLQERADRDYLAL